MSGKCRIIGRRASFEQKEALLQYLEENLMFANFLCDAPNANELLRLQWETLAEKLNTISGAQKSGPSWRKYWFDLREYTKKRMESVNNSDQCEYKKMIKNLTVTEIRILNIVNWRKNAAISVDQDTKFDITKMDPDDKYLSMQDFKISRIKTGRASDTQKRELIKYFEDNPDAIRVASNLIGDSKIKQRVWIELTHKLNAIDGTMKTSSKWAKYWNDIINYTRNRAKRAISHQITASNDRPPTDLEKRMLIIVGQHNLVNDWNKYWSDISAVTNYQIKIEKDSDNFGDDEGGNIEEEEEEESEWIDLSNDGLDDHNNIDITIAIESLSDISDNDNRLTDVTQNLQTTIMEANEQLQFAAGTRTTTTKSDDFDNVCCYEMDDETIEFAECNDDQVESSHQNNDESSHQNNDESSHQNNDEASSINNLINELEEHDIIDDDNNTIMNDNVNDSKVITGNSLNYNMDQHQPPRKKKKMYHNENDIITVDKVKMGCDRNGLGNNKKIKNDRQADRSFNENNVDDSNNSVDGDYDLSSAVYALGEAASSLATALAGLAKVLKNQKQFVK